MRAASDPVQRFVSARLFALTSAELGNANVLPVFSAPANASNVKFELLVVGTLEEIANRKPLDLLLPPYLETVVVAFGFGDIISPSTLRDVRSESRSEQIVSSERLRFTSNLVLRDVERPGSIPPAWMSQCLPRYFIDIARTFDMPALVDRDRSSVPRRLGFASGCFHKEASRERLSFCTSSVSIRSLPAAMFPAKLILESFP